MRSPRHYCKLSDFFSFFFFVRQINDDNDDKNGFKPDVLNFPCRNALKIDCTILWFNISSQ